MNSTEKRNILFTLVASLLSGISIFILDSYFQVEKPWGVVSHPYLDKAKMLHYLVTPLLVLSIGFIIKSHIFKKLKNLEFEKKKRTGLILCFLLVALIYSGQSLLFITDPTIKLIFVYIHLGIGLLSGATVMAHLRS
ncbi:MAG: hypothetical protein ACJAT2_001194 [Bacteriovoracaceae bacterium]|jgi:hypothetical protein